MYLVMARGLGRALGQPEPAPANLPRVTAPIRVRNTGASDPANCCAVCPVTLGVGQGGTASNGIELRATIAHHRPGIEYDFVRTRRNSLWERRPDGWHMLEYQPMGRNDDHHDDDECLRITGNHIFVIDQPGWNNLRVPLAAGTTLAGFTGVTTHADATDIVLRFSFAEWISARHRGDGIPWTRLTQPRNTLWFSITWLTRDAAGQYVLAAGRNRIRRGSLSRATLRSAPGP